MKSVSFFLLGILFEINVYSQEVSKTITLSEAIRLAQSQSLDAIVEKSKLRAAYWQYRNYKADLLPNVRLTGTLPRFNRSLSSYLKEDGTYKFVSSNSVSEQLSLEITQNLPLTGGQFSLQSQLERIDELDGDRCTEYMSVPFNVVFSQPLITSNPLRWDMKIEPEKYKQAQQQYAVGQEGIAMRTISYYFDLLLAKINVEIDRQNLENSEKLLQIAQGKRARGLISDNDVLQLRLNCLNASSSLIQTEQAYEQKMFVLRNYLGYTEYWSWRTGTIHSGMMSSAGIWNPRSRLLKRKQTGDSVRMCMFRWDLQVMTILLNRLIRICVTVNQSVLASVYRC